VRELNEDRYFAELLAPGPDNPWNLQALLVVADGMGGHQAGEVASRLAVQTVREIFASAGAAEKGPPSLHGRDLRASLEKAVHHVNDVVYQAGTGEGLARPGTTLTLALVQDNNFYIGHVGDSRTYLLRDGRADQITEDDSWVAEQVRAGRMTEPEARTSPFRNQLTQSIGAQAEVRPSVYPGAFLEGDILVLCSDGLTEYVTGAEIAEVALSSPTAQAACDRLVDLANERGGEDNVTVIIARVGQPPAADTEAPPEVCATSATRTLPEVCATSATRTLAEALPPRPLSEEAARAVTQPFLAVPPAEPEAPPTEEPSDRPRPLSQSPGQWRLWAWVLVIVLLAGLLGLWLGRHFVSR
jgi:protein phosphatase